MPPLSPMLAKAADELPVGEGWLYEPKWDGFRTLVFRDGDEVALISRGARPMTRYFPELLPGILALPAERVVLDGEIIIGDLEGMQDFGALQQRLHPAESRVRRLAEETPARYVAFDLLARGEEVLLELPFAERRAALAALIEEPVLLAPCTRDRAQADPWLRGAEGVIAKELDAAYLPGERRGMVKVKRLRTIDCVVVGWRPGKEADTVGSLILGLYDGGELRVVGHTSGFRVREKRDLVGKLAPYETGERGSGDPSRWTVDRDLEWVLLRPELVIEVSFDHTSGGRIRHGTKLLRWREDKAPQACTFDQLGA